MGKYYFFKINRYIKIIIQLITLTVTCEITNDLRYYVCITNR